MSPSFLEQIRANPPKSETICSIGFDPDLHTSGLGIIVGDISKPAVAQPAFKEAWAIIVEGHDHKAKLDDVQFADSMITEVMNVLHLVSTLSIAPADKVITTVEGQRLYPRPDDSKAKVIGMGNDLARLAQISGAVLLRTRMAPFDGSRLYLPEQWKGQAPKPTMHGDMAARLGAIPARLLVFKPGGGIKTDRQMQALDLPKLPKALGHALDAVCLAEFGLDRYHDDRWDYRW